MTARSGLVPICCSGSMAIGRGLLPRSARMNCSPRARCRDIRSICGSSTGSASLRPRRLQGRFTRAGASGTSQKSGPIWLHCCACLDADRCPAQHRRSAHGGDCAWGDVNPVHRSCRPFGRNRCQWLPHGPQSRDAALPWPETAQRCAAGSAFLGCGLLPQLCCGARRGRRAGAHRDARIWTPSRPGRRWGGVRIA